MNGSDELKYEERVWEEINIDNLLHNFKQTKSYLNEECKIMAVVKADAYGLGAVNIARELYAAGADWFGVATYSEAMQLINSGIHAPMLVLGVVPDRDVAELAENGVSLTVNSVQTAEKYAAAAKCPVKVHIKIDTGMTRLGIHTADGIENAAEQAIKICGISGIQAEGIFTHFSSADSDEQKDFTMYQLEQFNKVVEYIEQRNVKIPIKHCANAPALIKYKQTHLDMVRPGMTIFGNIPANAGGQEKEKFKPVASMRALVVQVSDVPSGTHVSYGGNYITDSPGKIAVVGFGYVDGITRACSGKIYAVIKGRKVPQIGTICMDMCMFDVTEIEDIKEGDVATIFGSDGNEQITTAEIAEAAGTNANEILTCIGKRVPKIYYKNGREVSRLECI